jgi:5-methylcytosine-specific restriction endonuclease McrA
LNLLALFARPVNSGVRFQNDESPLEVKEMSRETTLNSIFQKSRGCCHFCGDSLIFENYDVGSVKGSWNIDHVIQKSKGGLKGIDNCLPACVPCNRLRWNYTGEELREALFLGIIALKEIRKNSEVGRKLIELKTKRLDENRSRRKPKVEISVADVERVS